MNRYYEWSMLVLRIILGIILLAHGLQKIAGFEGTVRFFGSLGLPVVLVYVVTAIETVGGACLILGMFTRIVAVGISLVLFGAIITVQFSKGLVGGYDFPLSLLSMAVALIFSGSHMFALDNHFGKQE